MKSITILFVFIISYLTIDGNLNNINPPNTIDKIVLLQPTGEIIDSLPEMKTISDTSNLYVSVMNMVDSSIIGEFLELYYLTQIYLYNEGQIDVVEPAYLALTENVGGFAKFGFVLNKDGEKIIKKNAPFVDIRTGRISQNPAKLMSFTQLYPHELGHVFVHTLCPEDTVENNTRSVDMHFFSVITDYSTAFNEGFSEHIENVARLFEQNDNIKKGIETNTEQIFKKSGRSINGFERDYIYPFRLGYYKATMLNWFQKFEDYKRYKFALNGDIRFKSATVDVSNPEDALTFRNSGVKLNMEKTKNIVQLLSTEGAVCTFLTHLSISELSKQYADSSFYRPFVADTTISLAKPEKIFSPLQNQFIKYFYVLRNFVVFNNSDKSQITDFADGYMQTFPSEAKQVKSLFKKALGVEYTNNLPPPLWLMLKNYQHRLLTFDPYSAITVPLYVFDLNTAEVEDLLTIEGLSREGAQQIIDHRNTNGFFTGFEQLKSVHDLSPEISKKIETLTFDEEHFEKTLENFDTGLTISALIVKPLLSVFSKSAIYFLLIFAAVYFLFGIKEKMNTKQLLRNFVDYFLVWLLFVISGLIFVAVLTTPVLAIVGLTIFFALISIIINRKQLVKSRKMLLFLCLSCLTIIISM